MLSMLTLFCLALVQFIRDPNMKKYDNIRVFRNVRFAEAYVTPQKVGSVVEVDHSTKRRFKNIHWDHSKRFIFGSLLLFTKDNFNSFIVAIILDRDAKFLSRGKIPVSIVDINTEKDLLKKHNLYTMIESEVYFEPYYHILKVLQDPMFPEHIAMKKYIIDVDPQPNPPSYLKEDTKFEVRLSIVMEVQFNVLDFNTWPSNIDLNLNESQYEAYKTALTHEFAVIQGPPGTGKTYLGVKIATTILENIMATESTLLLVCYTNHALDQFLEALIPVTDSVVRIGGRSRNEALDRFNLNSIRKNHKLSHDMFRLLSTQRENLRSAIIKLQRCQADLDSINNIIVSYNYLKKYCPASNAIGKSYRKILDNGKDPLCYWLFENLQYNYDEPITDTSFQYDHNDQQEAVRFDDESDNRHEIVLDDLEIDLREPYGDRLQRAFSLKDSHDKLRGLITQYLSCKNAKKKYDLHVEIIFLRTRINHMKEMKDQYLYQYDLDENNVAENLQDLSVVGRWMLYYSWTKCVTDELKRKLLPLQEAVRSFNTAYEETRMLADYKILRNVRVVGMTTSGAARFRKLVQELAHPIVIVEEAAEVLEQHIVTSLTKNCQHLILIGDHQQLRPSAAYMRLAKHFHLEVSLFERMIRNALHSRRLAVQHRMRPEISALISPHIYPDLQDHPSVAAFPDVRGVTSNVFFFTHDWFEDTLANEDSSRTNTREGDMILGLANYIMQQGYEPEDVTILTPYSGQMFYLRKQRQRYAHLTKIKITVVDNYQGEESKIILLSLVRNNQENKIGFLGTENRICVALSRAKEGFYIMGNIDLLKQNSTLWTKIAATLESQGGLGTSIHLKCENHSTQITTVSTFDDFKNVPEGGCLLKCNYSLPCLHACPLVCHSYDRGHVETKCLLKCEKIICELNHICPLMCQEMCTPCKQMVRKKLPCGHEKDVYCYLEPENPTIKCLIPVSVKLPDCGHEVKKPCHLDTKKVECPVPCGLRVDSCGHVCLRKCHVKDDPDHEKYNCPKPCIKAKKGCTQTVEGDLDNHQCRKKCYEECDDCNVEVTKKRAACKHKERVACSRSADELPCRRPCARTLPCGHFCRKKCFEPCGDCKTMVTKVIPDCGHEVKIECRKVATRSLCESACERRLGCGHACARRCAEPCAVAVCEQLVAPRPSPCGHDVQLPCNVLHAQEGSVSGESLQRWCRAACGARLACGHACAGSCAACLRGRLHAPCQQRCNQLNICGHDCEEPCNTLCPPCSKPCELRCDHARCPRPCGAPCVPCQEKCSRGCPHGSCSARCGAACSRAACAQACARRLACGHACRGLCGERCPPACRACRPDDFPRDVLNLGDEFDDDARFIVLEDCGHILEFTYVEYIMNTKSEDVNLKCCPLCRKPIINTPRYKDLVNKMFQTDINPIKKKVFGDEQEIIRTRNKLVEVIKKFVMDHKEIYSDKLYPEWNKAFNKIVHYITTQKKSSLLQLNMHFISLDILEMLSEIYKKFTSAKLKELENNLIDQISIISKVIFDNVRKLTEQQQLDIRNEIKRTNAILQLSKILSHNAYIMSKNELNVKKAAEDAKESVLGYDIYKDVEAKNALGNFQTAVKASGIITKQERDLIIKAIGAKAGQWFKCPNGHFYSIGQCGGAMEVSKCIECKADIGGRNHALLSGNAHAPEIDNSRFPAWSQEANNMANFDLDNLL